MRHSLGIVQWIVLRPHGIRTQIYIRLNICIHAQSICLHTHRIIIRLLMILVTNYLMIDGHGDGRINWEE